MARFIVADWDDMVFEDRNQSFGAYALRKSYPKHLLIGTLGISMLLLLSTWGPLYAKRMGWIGVENRRPREIAKVQFSDPIPINPKDEELIEPPELPKPQPPAVETREFLVPEPAPDDEVEEAASMSTVDQLTEAPNFGPDDIDGEDIVAFFPPTDGEEDVPELITSSDPGPGIFISVEQEPVPVNIADITSLIGYPQIARDANIEGTIVARILVDKFGNYDRHIIVREAHPILQDEVEKHLSKLKFTPAIQGGNPIKFWVNVPFRFRLMQ